MADFSLVAELKANTSNFISGIKKGEESLKSFGGIVDNWALRVNLSWLLPPLPLPP